MTNFIRFIAKYFGLPKVKQDTTNAIEEAEKDVIPKANIAQESELHGVPTHKHHPDTTLKNEEKQPCQAIVEFYLDNNDEVGINIRWDHCSESTATKLGILLSYINNGKFIGACSTLIGTSAQGSPEQKAFAVQCLKAWNGQEKDGLPIIKPSQVFSMGFLKDKK